MQFGYVKMFILRTDELTDDIN